MVNLDMLSLSTAYLMAGISLLFAQKHTLLFQKEIGLLYLCFGLLLFCKAFIY